MDPQTSSSPRRHHSMRRPLAQISFLIRSAVILRPLRLLLRKPPSGDVKSSSLRLRQHTALAGLRAAPIQRNSSRSVKIIWPRMIDDVSTPIHPGRPFAWSSPRPSRHLAVRHPPRHGRKKTGSAFIASSTSPPSAGIITTVARSERQYSPHSEPSLTVLARRIAYVLINAQGDNRDAQIRIEPAEASNRTIENHQSKISLPLRCLFP